MEGQLVGSEIHGFHTLQDLDVQNIMEDARTRWLRPNEIHAILCNYKYFSIHVKPLNLPPSGTILLFDRKMLRNFRKDGHNWKKKKDGKTVKEAHEHLKVGNEERIHVYYAHGQDNPTFVRRCYWLLDKSLEHIVLVHYRETQEGSPSTPVNSNSSSVSDPSSAPWLSSEEHDSGANHVYSAGEKELLAGPGDNLTIQNHQLRLQEINTLEWDELLLTNDSNNSTAPTGDKVSTVVLSNQIAANGSLHDGANNFSAEVSSFGNLTGPISRSNNIHSSFPDNIHIQALEGQVNTNEPKGDYITLGASNSLDILVDGGLQSQDSFGRWMNHIMVDSPGSVVDTVIESSISSGHESFVSSAIDHHKSFVPEQIFSITDVSPAWAFSNEKTKVDIYTLYLFGIYSNLPIKHSNLLGATVRLINSHEWIRPGPLTMAGKICYSQILVTGLFHEQYLHLVKSSLFCVCGDICVPLEPVQVGVYRCSVLPHSPGLVNLFMSFDGHRPISQVLNFEYRTPVVTGPVLSSEEKNKWEEFQVQLRLACLLFSTSRSLNILSSKVSPNALKEAKKFASKTSNILNGWESLIRSIEDNKPPFPQVKDGLFELALKNRLREWLLERVVEGSKTKEYDVQGLSLDIRDKHGWTALHWAAYCGREEMVAVLLSAGAKPNLVTDPTPKNPGGCTAADLAFLEGYEGLAGYLSEKALIAQFKDMSVAGNISGSLDTSSADTLNTENTSEDQLYLKDTLAAYRTTAEAAARIQAAFRERSLKLRTQEAVFRGFQVRRQYRKILWSVGVLEKAVLRWRLKRKGFRGLHVDPIEAEPCQKQESDEEEDFYQTSRKQAEDRIDRAVVRVQAMFRSKKAQEDYRRMKIVHNQAMLEYEALLGPDIDMK
ncbi:Calmodulin-binding transcription activator 5 [Morella rubra]|uniref:Calmodulin-binding transcription activator 5 n=1 Tax=Morella rubra TaxID=262757 RepID=A0A6A1VMJ8_9ROSI|nr:Calmodulin-binding transcription activator 5 [Morella rubra]